MIFWAVDQITPRVEYIAQILFKDLMGQDFKIVLPHQINNSEDLIINYSETFIPNSISVPNAGLLYETEIKNFTPAINNNAAIPPKLFMASKLNNYQRIDFDLFSASFYIITEYEKYIFQNFDLHSRYDEKLLWSTQNNLPQYPLIQVYTEYLKDEILKLLPRFKFNKIKTKFQISIDVDFPWCYLHKGTFINFIGLLRDIAFLKYKVTADRINTLLKFQKDPYDLLPMLDALKAIAPESVYLFFLLDGTTRFDNRFKSNNPHLQALIKTCQQGYPNIIIGAHPSYESYLNSAKLTQEVSALATIIQKPILHSRQHFLKYKLPETYQNLIKIGIQHEYTGTYSSVTGYKYGLAIPFKWFDLSQNITTNLTLHPTMAMDRTLNSRLHHNPEEAFDKIFNDFKELQKYGGNYMILVHNYILGEYNEWKNWAIFWKNIANFYQSIYSTNQ